MPDPGPSRKLSWAGLWVPFLIAGLLVAGWSAGWVYAARQVEAGLERGVANLRAAGTEVAWSSKRLSGYPFRLNLALSDLRVATGGWVLETSDLEAQAFLHAPRNWLLATPAGLKVTRPEGGGLEVRGRRILASFALAAERMPRVSVEGLSLTFRALPGARPFALAGAERLELHLRPGPNDQAAVFLRLEGGAPEPGRLFAELGGGAPVSGQLEAIADRASLLGQPTALRAWSAAGGRLELRQAGLTTGETRLSLASPGLGASPDGRLSGRLTLRAAGPPEVLQVLLRHGVISPDEAAGGLAAAGLAGQSAADTQIDVELSAGRARWVRPR
jgi:hypothetical protein